MSKYKQCQCPCPCPECKHFSKNKWRQIAVCEQYHIALGTEDLRDSIKLRVEQMHKLQSQHRDLLYQVSYAAERHLSSEERHFCNLWNRYQQAEFELVPWLNGCALTDSDREMIYAFLEAADQAEDSMKEK